MSFDDYKDTDFAAAEEDALPACPNCNPIAEDAEPCGSECEAIITLAADRRVIAGKYEQARAAIRRARLYTFEDACTGHTSRRSWEIVHKVLCLREDIRELRAAR